MKINDGVTMTPLGRRLVAVVDKHYPEAKQLYVTSSLRDEPGSHHGGRLSWNGSPTIAVDFGFYDDPEDNDKDQRDARAFSQWIYDHFSDLLAELIHTTPYPDDNGFYVTYGTRHSGFGPATDNAHINHIHAAVSEDSMTAIENRIKVWGWGASQPTSSDSGELFGPNMVA